MMFNVNEEEDDEKADEIRIQKVANKISNIFVVFGIKHLWTYVEISNNSSRKYVEHYDK